MAHAVDTGIPILILIDDLGTRVDIGRNISYGITVIQDGLGIGLLHVLGRASASAAPTVGLGAGPNKKQVASHLIETLFHIGLRPPGRC